MEGQSTGMIKKPLMITHLRQGQQSEMIALLTHWHFQRLRSKAVLEANIVAQVMIQDTVLLRIGFLGQKAPRTPGRSKNRSQPHQVRTLTCTERVAVDIYWLAFRPIFDPLPLH